jgi:hypothetical protein
MHRHLRGWLAAGLMAAALVASRSAVAGFVESFKDWNVYVSDGEKGQTCYIASVPTKMSGNYTNRGAAAVLVAKLPMDPPNVQVSVEPGYSYGKGSPVVIKIGSKSFNLFTQGEHAWARTPDDDKAMIDAMKGGLKMTVSGTSTKSTTSLDTYSLLGFTDAFNAMQGRCKK